MKKKDQEIRESFSYRSCKRAEKTKTRLALDLQLKKFLR